MLKGGMMATMPHEYVKTQWEHNAQHRDGSVEGVGDAAWVGMVAPTLGEPTSILDVGCRTGMSLTVLESYFPNARVVGVDIVPPFVDMALAKGCEALVADAHHLPFEDKEFEWVVCNGTFEHFYNSLGAAKEMLRVAHKGWITCDLREHPLGSDYAHSPDVIDWQAVFIDAGWRVVEWHKMGAGVAFTLVEGE